MKLTAVLFIQYFIDIISFLLWWYPVFSALWLQEERPVCRGTELAVSNGFFGDFMESHLLAYPVNLSLVMTYGYDL